MSDILLKSCTHCHEVKSLDDFHKHDRAKDGRNSWCKDCARARAKQSRKEGVRARRVDHDSGNYFRPRGKVIL